MSGLGTSIEQILRQAIQYEEDAYGFYTDAVKLVRLAHVKETLRELGEEEIKHKEKLESLLAGGADEIVAAQKQAKIEDLKLAEYLVAPGLDENATFQDVLIVAMKREKSSYDFYSTMVGIAAQESARSLFEFLAQEELAHKNKVETLYDQAVYTEF